jgi:hypothetical protein
LATLRIDCSSVAAAFLVTVMMLNSTIAERVEAARSAVR